MTRPALTGAQRRVPISVTLSPHVLAMLDELIAQGIVHTKSAAVEYAIRAYHLAEIRDAFDRRTLRDCADLPKRKRPGKQKRAS